MKTVVFDSSVMIAILKQEPGYEAQQYLGSALMSTVNLAEVAKKLADFNYEKTVIQDALDSFAVEAIPFTYEDIQLSAQLSRQTQPYGLSLGDRICLGLGISRKLPILTADKIWKKLEGVLNVDIQLIR